MMGGNVVGGAIKVLGPSIAPRTSKNASIEGLNGGHTCTLHTLEG